MLSLRSQVWNCVSSSSITSVVDKNISCYTSPGGAVCTLLAPIVGIFSSVSDWGVNIKQYKWVLLMKYVVYDPRQGVAMPQTRMGTIFFTKYQAGIM